MVPVSWPTAGRVEQLTKGLRLAVNFSERGVPQGRTFTAAEEKASQRNATTVSSVETMSQITVHNHDSTIAKKASSVRVQYVCARHSM